MQLSEDCLLPSSSSSASSSNYSASGWSSSGASDRSSRSSWTAAEVMMTDKDDSEGTTMQVDPSAAPPSRLSSVQSDPPSLSSTPLHTSFSSSCSSALTEPSPSMSHSSRNGSPSAKWTLSPLSPMSAAQASTSGLPDFGLPEPSIPYNYSSHYRGASVPSSASSAYATSAAPSDTEDDSDADDWVPWKEPPNFALVEEGLYRSSFPRKDNFSFIKGLKLKAVLSFTQEPYPEINRQFLARNNIDFYQIGMPGNKEDTVHIPVDDLRKALCFALDPSNYPLLLHCNKGKHRTGCVVGCIRKLQNRPIEQVLEEYIKHSTPKERKIDQHCIKQFDVGPVWETISSTGCRPPWLSAYLGNTCSAQTTKVDVR